MQFVFDHVNFGACPFGLQMTDMAIVRLVAAVVDGACVKLRVVCSDRMGRSWTTPDAAKALATQGAPKRSARLREKDMRVSRELRCEGVKGSNEREGRGERGRGGE